MTIKTEYALTQEVWIMRDNKPKPVNIYSVEPIVKITGNILSDGNPTIIRYRF